MCDEIIYVISNLKFKEVQHLKEKDVSKMINMANNLNINESSFEKLKDEANRKGVMEKAEKLEEEYAPRFRQFLKENGDLSNLSNEEKARVILEYKEKLPKKEQEQFEKVLSLLKSYVKKNKSR